MATRLRTVLPIIAGVVSAPLMVWDAHNQRIITSMGMAWDTGAPLWPYQTPDILLRFANFPAYVVAQPALNLLRWYGGQIYLFVLPATLMWWWLVGLGLEYGLVRSTTHRRWFLFGALLGAEPLLLWLTFESLADVFRYWLSYGRSLPPLSQALITFRLVTPAPWTTFFGVIIGFAARRALTRSASSQT